MAGKKAESGSIKGLEALLSGPWDGVEALWRSLLPDLLAEIWSTVKAEEVAAELAADAWLIDLEARWPELAPRERRRAVDELGAWLAAKAYQTRPYCIRCGRCCQEGGPALLAGEAALVEPGGPLAGQAYTVRAGEPVRDGRRGQVRQVERERIKLKDDPDGCVFYDRNQGCTVYKNRPEQCRALECWRPETSAWAEEGPFLNRSLLLSGDTTRQDFITAHQARCPADRATRAALSAAEEGPDSPAWAALRDMIGFDLHVRNFALDKGALAAEELDLVLGRPLGLVLAPLGWRVAVGQGRLEISLEGQDAEQ